MRLLLLLLPLVLVRATAGPHRPPRASVTLEECPNPRKPAQKNPNHLRRLELHTDLGTQAHLEIEYTAADLSQSTLMSGNEYIVLGRSTHMHPIHPIEYELYPATMRFVLCRDRETGAPRKRGTGCSPWNTPVPGMGNRPVKTIAVKDSTPNPLLRFNPPEYFSQRHWVAAVYGPTGEQVVLLCEV